MPASAVSQRQATYICEMMERLGLEPAAGAIPRLSLSHITAFHRCEACRANAICRAWLDHHPGPLTFAPRFCPNGDIFFEMKFNDPGALR